MPALVGAIVLGSASTAFAAQDAQNNGQGKVRGQEMRAQAMQNKEARSQGDEAGFIKGMQKSERIGGIIGEITAISGTTLTLTIKGPEDQTKTLTVDASSATFEKITFDGSVATGTKPTPSTQTINELTIGEKVAIKIDGDIDENTTSVVATMVTELSGDMPGRHTKEGRERIASSTKQKMHEGKRGIVGEVLSIGDDTLTVEAMNGTEYTVDAADAVIKNGTTTVSFTDIATGERIAVRGELDDTTIVANMIMTNIPETPAHKNASETGKQQSIMGKIGSFFGKLFGKKSE